MTVGEMHYDFKQKLNKIDSEKYRNLIVPEIDWKLNEAQEVFIKVIAQPRYKSQIGFEINQRTIDDIRSVVINQTPATAITATVFDDSSFKVEFPEEYWFHLSSKAIATKNTCTKNIKTVIVQHDDEHETSPFNRSSFEWNTVNIRFIKEGIRLFTDKTFSISKLILDYIKRPALIYNAAEYINGTYNLGGQTLTGTQDCELPKGTHREIVDLAVLITAGDLSLPDYQFKQNKVKLTQ